MAVADSCVVTAMQSGHAHIGKWLVDFCGADINEHVLIYSVSGVCDLTSPMHAHGVTVTIQF